MGWLCVVIARSHLNKVFSPDIGVEPSTQVLDILKYACGLTLGFALISTENPNFELLYSPTRDPCKTPSSFHLLIRLSSKNFPFG
jgi:hypothetical protein